MKDSVRLIEYIELIINAGIKSLFSERVSRK